MPLRDVAARAAVVALVAALVVGAWNALPALLIIFGGLLIALLLGGLAELIRRRTGFPYRASLAVGGLGVLAVIVGVVWFVGDGLVTQLTGLREALPAGLGRAAELLRSWANGIGVPLPDLDGAGPSPQVLVSGALGVVGSAVGVIASVAIAVLLGVFFASSPDTYRRGILHMVPLARRERADEIMVTVARAVQQWLVSRLIIMAITFVTTLIGLSLIGVPFAGGLAVLSALVVFVPYIGPYISGGAAAIVALLDGPQTAAYTVVFYLAVENLQGWTVEPLIEARLTSAPPGVLLSAQVILGLLLGAAGILLASPLAVATMVLVQMVYVQDALGDDVPALGEGRARRRRLARRRAREVAED